jgi:hypothetical protein
MQFLKKVQNRTGEFLAVDPQEATHILSDSGKLHIFNNSLVNNIPDDNCDEIPEFLGLPTMNFGEKKEEKEKTSRVNNGDLPEGLPLPVMNF